MRLYRIDLLNSEDKCVASDTNPRAELDTFDKAMSQCKKKQNSRIPRNVGDHFVVVHLESGEVVFGSVERRKYRVDFWDSFDHWIASGLPVGFDPENEFEDLEKAIELCKEKQIDNPPNDMGEHYGVIDLVSQREVFCGKGWYSASEEKKKTETIINNIHEKNVNQLLDTIVDNICSLPTEGNRELMSSYAEIVTMVARIKQHLGLPMPLGFDVHKIK